MSKPAYSPETRGEERAKAEETSPEIQVLVDSGRRYMEAYALVRLQKDSYNE